MTKPQLKMNWPTSQLAHPPKICLPDGYTLRNGSAPDETAFVALMHDCGWTDWSDERLAYCRSRLLPDGWFVIVEDVSEQLVASAMSLHNYTDKLPFSGTLGWVGCTPKHRGNGLGSAIAAAVTGRFIDAGYRDIELYTEHFRAAALRSYLRLGFVPYLYDDAVAEVWQEVCIELAWPFAPDQWPAGDNAFPTTSTDN